MLRKVVVFEGVEDALDLVEDGGGSVEFVEKSLVEDEEVDHPGQVAEVLVVEVGEFVELERERAFLVRYWLFI